jgi:hypothetical protein
MTSSITIAAGGDHATSLRVAYDITLAGDVQMINCSIEEAAYPAWLQVRKFVLQSYKEGNSYVPIFIEINSSRNLDTTLFIDKAYTDIMHAENFDVIAFAS